eukprot:366467-Chlamydomonas_euryale.AAC.4
MALALDPTPDWKRFPRGKVVAFREAGVCGSGRAVRVCEPAPVQRQARVHKAVPHLCERALHALHVSSADLHAMSRRSTSVGGGGAENPVNVTVTITERCTATATVTVPVTITWTVCGRKGVRSHNTRHGKVAGDCC